MNAQPVGSESYQINYPAGQGGGAQPYDGGQLAYGSYPGYPQYPAPMRRPAALTLAIVLAFFMMALAMAYTIFLLVSIPAVMTLSEQRSSNLATAVTIMLLVFMLFSSGISVVIWLCLGLILFIRRPWVRIVVTVMTVFAVLWVLLTTLIGMLSLNILWGQVILGFITLLTAIMLLISLWNRSVTAYLKQHRDPAQLSGPSYPQSYYPPTFSG